MRDDADELRSDLVDLTGIRLEELLELPPTVLNSSLVRILRESEQQPRSFQQANFKSSI